MTIEVKYVPSTYIKRCNKVFTIGKPNYRLEFYKYWVKQLE